MFTLKDFENVVREKFIENKSIDYISSLTEKETVNNFMKNIKNEGIEFKNIKDVPLFFYLIRYSEDKINNKYIYNSDTEDVMQTARATITTLRGDCEDIHRLYNIANLNFLTENTQKLLILFFGNEKGIIGGHATALTVSGGSYINQDYNFYVSGGSLNSILSYLSDSYYPVYSYVILGIDTENSEDIINYKVEDSGFFNADKQHESYNAEYINNTRNVYNLTKKLYRSGEFEKNIKYSLIAALSIAAIFLGGKIL
jgi:hypothetical protein